MGDTDQVIGTPSDCDTFCAKLDRESKILAIFNVPLIPGCPAKQWQSTTPLVWTLPWYEHRTHLHLHGEKARSQSMVIGREPNALRSRFGFCYSRLASCLGLRNAYLCKTGSPHYSPR